MQKLRRDAAILTRVEELSEHDLLVTMTMKDVFSIQMNVVNRAQASLLERNFRGNAEKIYQVLLGAVTDDYKKE